MDERLDISDIQVANLRTYILNFPGNFVGFFQSVGDILNDLGEDWNAYGKEKWGKIFVDRANQCYSLTTDLDKINQEYVEEQKNANGSSEIATSL